MNDKSTKWKTRTIGRAIFASAVLLFAPDALAENGDESPQDSVLSTPAYPNEKPSWAAEPKTAESKPPSWYGWQIIAPTAAFDVLGVIGAPLIFTQNSEVAAGLLLTSVIGRSLSGPIVHLAHGHGYRALASLGLETSGVVVGLISTAITLKVCDDILSDDPAITQKKCNSHAVAAALIGIPLATAITGTIIDSMFLAREKPESPTKQGALPFLAAPYFVPTVQHDEGTGKRQFSMQFGFAGRF